MIGQLIILALFLLSPFQGARSRVTQGHVTRTPLRTLKGHSNVIYSVAFSHNGTMLATASADYTTSIWDTTTWTKCYTLKAGEAYMRSVTFSFDDKILSTNNGISWDT